MAQRRRRRAFDATTPIGRVALATGASQMYANVLQRRLATHEIHTFRPRAPAAPQPFAAMRCALCGEAAEPGRAIFLGCTTAPWQPCCGAHGI